MVVDLGTEHGTEFGPNKGSRPKGGRSVFGVSGNVMKGDSAKRETRLTADSNITEPDRIFGDGVRSPSCEQVWRS